jgi:hypothetical protein
LGYPSQLSYMLNAKQPATLCLAFRWLTRLWFKWFTL